MEIYEERFWEAVRTNQGKLPSGRTLAIWADRFLERRRTMFREQPDPFPAVHRHTFRLTNRAAPETLHYFDPSTCRPGNARVGIVVIER